MAKKKTDRGGKGEGTGGAKKNKWNEMDMPNKLDLVEGMARDGGTDLEIMQALGISHTLFYNWKGKYPEFKEALNKGKEIVDVRVENALLKRALGYTYDEITKESTYNERENKWEMTETKRVTKEVQPDTTAQIFWLKNRRPDKWRDRKQIDANLNHNGFEYMSDEELLAEAKRLDLDE